MLVTVTDRYRLKLSSVGIEAEIEVCVLWYKHNEQNLRGTAIGSEYANELPLLVRWSSCFCTIKLRLYGAQWRSQNEDFVVHMFKP